MLWTPGHTITSLSLHDARAKLLFTGDLIYTTSLYAFLPDSSLRDYEATTERLLARMPTDTVVYGAHCCRNDVPTSAPWLHLSDIADLHRVLVEVRSGHAASTGLLLRRYPVNAQMTLLTFYPFGND